VHDKKQQKYVGLISRGLIKIGYACEVYVIIHEVGCRTELPLSAWRDRRTTDILHNSHGFQKCSRGFDRKPRSGMGLTHIGIWHSEAVRRRWLGIAVHVSSISKAIHSPQTVSYLPNLVDSLDLMVVPDHLWGVRIVPERPCLCPVLKPNTFSHQGGGYCTEKKNIPFGEVPDQQSYHPFCTSRLTGMTKFEKPPELRVSLYCSPFALAKAS
jgi:hypothetical protein